MVQIYITLFCLVLLDIEEEKVLFCSSISIQLSYLCKSLSILVVFSKSKFCKFYFEISNASHASRIKVFWMKANIGALNLSFFNKPLHVCMFPSVHSMVKLTDRLYHWYVLSNKCSGWANQALCRSSSVTTIMALMLPVAACWSSNIKITYFRSSADESIEESAFIDHTFQSFFYSNVLGFTQN